MFNNLQLENFDFVLAAGKLSKKHVCILNLYKLYENPHTYLYWCIYVAIIISKLCVKQHFLKQNQGMLEKCEPHLKFVTIFNLIRVLKSCESNQNLQISHSTCISSGFGFFYIYFCDIIFIFGRNYSWGLGLPQQFFEFYYYLKIKLVRFIVKMPC